MATALIVHGDHCPRSLRLYALQTTQPLAAVWALGLRWSRLSMCFLLIFVQNPDQICADSLVLT